MNLKQVRLKRQIDEVDNESVSVSISGQEQITAGDFQKFISGFQVLTPDHVICNLDPKVSINMDLTIEKGEIVTTGLHSQTIYRARKLR